MPLICGAVAHIGATVLAGRLPRLVDRYERHDGHHTRTNSTDAPPHRYSAELAQDIELQWQDWWDEHHTFETPNTAGPLADPELAAARGEKLFVLDMFPYPSGTGLHVGHPLGFIGTDVFARFKRMTGHNVLHAMGFDAFGLPAEQFAVETGQHPAVTTAENIATYRRQLRRLGLAHDPRRSVSTTDPEFYRWTQWIFTQVFNAWYDTDADRARPIAELIGEFESGQRPTPDGRPWAELTTGERADIVDDHRLAYVSEAPVNWCPGLGTVVANEEVTADGRSDRGNFPVFKRNMRQWMMRITTYADRLIDDLELLDWTDAIKSMQRNWIGRSYGAEVHFPVTFVDGPAGEITVFTTRPDTLFGASFMVLSPEHPLRRRADRARPGRCRRRLPDPGRQKKEFERQDENREKTGVFTGSYATNPVNGDQIPVWIADYVLMGYGTGAIMAVPCGDQRDFEFARKFGLPIPAIQQPPAAWFAGHDIEPTLDTALWPVAYVGDAPYVQSSERRTRPERRRQQGRRHRPHELLAGGARRRDRHGQLQAARLAVQPPAVLGRALPGRLRRRRTPPRPPRRHAPGAAARDRVVLPADVRRGRRVLQPGEPTRPTRRLGGGRTRSRPRERPRPTGLSARHQRHAAVGGFVLVRDALPRPHERTAFRRP